MRILALLSYLLITACKLSFKRSLLLTCQILGHLVNTLAADQKYPVLKCDNELVADEMYPVLNRDDLSIGIQI